MTTKSNTTGIISTHPPAFLLPMDAEGFTRLLETIAGETPEIFTDKLSERRIESAHRRAWCEVTEASEKFQPSAEGSNHAQLAHVSAQRKLTGILEGLIPAIVLRNQKVATAAEPSTHLRHLKENAEPIETEIAELKARDVRDEQGDIPNTEPLAYEIDLLENYLDNGEWKDKGYELADVEFEAGLRKLIGKGEYTGEPTKEAVMQRIADLTKQNEEANSKIKNMLRSSEIYRLKELETKLLPIQAEITAAEDSAATMVAEAEASALELKVKLNSAAIIATAIIQACHIKSGTSIATA